MNVINDAQKALNTSTLGHLAEHLQVDPESAPQLIEESLAALIAVFRNVARDDSKTAMLNQFLSEIDTSILSDPNALLIEQGIALTRSGKSGLAQLLGPRLTDYIAPVAKRTGLGEGKVASTLGTLAPFVIALLSKKAADTQSLRTLLNEDETELLEPVPKTRNQKTNSTKSYLPDPSKKKDKRPFPKRKAILLLVAIALVAALAFWLIDSGILSPPKNDSLEKSPPNTKVLTAPQGQNGNDVSP